jgi:hypothetical protein
MGIRTKTRTTTKKRVLNEMLRDADGLSSLEIQLLRMRYGIEEEVDAPVGDPDERCGSELVARLRKIERQVRQRAMARRSHQSTVKNKIVRTLQKKN